MGFNAGDSLFWHVRTRYLPFRGDVRDWPDWLETCLARHRITGLVHCGELRPVHAEALKIARNHGLRKHLFEEGYLRPHWFTCEPTGTIGNSPLMTLDVDGMDTAFGGATDLREAPVHWSEMREPVAYGTLHHAAVIGGAWRYPRYRCHRDISVGRRFRLCLRRRLLIPVHHTRRALSSRHQMRGGIPDHPVLLQLGHDAGFRTFSPFASMTEFLDLVLEGFAEGHRLPITSFSKPIRPRMGERRFRRRSPDARSSLGCRTVSPF